MSFYYESDIGYTSVRFCMAQVPRVGERVVLIWSYDTRLEGVVESVNWEVNARRQHQDTDQVYVSVHFEGEAKLETCLKDST